MTTANLLLEHAHWSGVRDQALQMRRRRRRIRKRSIDGGEAAAPSVCAEPSAAELRVRLRQSEELSTDTAAAQTPTKDGERDGDSDGGGDGDGDGDGVTYNLHWLSVAL